MRAAETGGLPLRYYGNETAEADETLNPTGPTTETQLDDGEEAAPHDEPDEAPEADET